MDGIPGYSAPDQQSDGMKEGLAQYWDKNAESNPYEVL
jgi:hypothetical protein